MNEPKWNSTSNPPPDGIIVETKIDDANGARNEALLKKRGNLWFFADESMYVYYTPTHWREADPAKVRGTLQSKADGLRAEADRILAMGGGR